DQFHFLGGGIQGFSIDPFNARAALGSTASLSNLFTLNVQTASEDRAAYFYNNKNTTSSTFGVYGGAFGAGSGDKRGGSFDASGGTGMNVGVKAFAGGGSENRAVWGSASGASDYAGYFQGRGYFSENIGLGITPTTSRQLNILADGNQYIGSYVKNEYSGTAAKYSYYAFMDAQGTGPKYNMYATMAANSTDASANYGVYSYVNSSSTPGSVYGMYSAVTSSGTGNRYGMYASSGGSSADNAWSAYLVGKARIISGVDASLSNDGYLQLGSKTSINVVMDNNEIMARNNGATAPLYLQNDGGAVSIGGGSATGYILTVDGKIMGEELKIQNSSAWPDYVFEEDYDLKTIDEYEAIIKAQNHLPGIPSAKEIDENGIVVGDMQRRQMEKIEELALYIIELNKRMKKVEEENNSLKKEIESLKK
ncbi:MAG: hypothetical protein AAGK97_07945, partial [Bacteroidota bacterium]